MTQELAGLGVGVAYLKHQMEGQLCASPRDGFVVSAGLQGGLMVQTGTQKPTIADRFFLGGPISVRGFATGGLGPQALSNSFPSSPFFSSSSSP
jgi:outer membrane protein insertion porin family